MLSRDDLTGDQWLLVRNAPHHVALAVSAAKGSLLDEMLERSAAMAGIVDAANSPHPLLAGIARSADIMHAQDQVRAWYHGLADADRNAAVLQDKALVQFRDAIRTLKARGGREDVEHYGAFVLALATRVARSAREGDVLGYGGELVSGEERSFIARLEAALGAEGR